MISPLSPAFRSQILDTRERMLQLHKILLDSERDAYVKTHGPVSTSAQMLQLVLSHPDFEWLRAISKLIVQFDEWMAEKEEATEEAGQALLGVARQLFQLGDSSKEFSRKYSEAIARDKAVAAHHRELLTALGGWGH